MSLSHTTAEFRWRQAFCLSLIDARVPDGYSPSASRQVIPLGLRA